MTWPPPSGPQVDGPGNMAGFGARRMHEEQQREAERQRQDWDRAEAERQRVQMLQQQEADRQYVEEQKQRLAWEWSELQRQQQEVAALRVQVQQEQAYAAEQQRLHYEQEQQRLFQQQQQQLQEQQQLIERQQEELQRQQSELQKQQQLQQEEFAEKERQLKKAQVELQRKVRSQEAAAQQLEAQHRQQKQLAEEQLQRQKEQQHKLELEQQELLKQQQHLQLQLQKQKQQQRHEAELVDEGDETLQAVPDADLRDAPPTNAEVRTKKSTRNLRQRTPSTVKRSEQRTKAWAAEHAEPLLVFCGDCQQDIPLSHMDNHPCMRRTHSGSASSSVESARTMQDGIRADGTGAVTVRHAAAKAAASGSGYDSTLDQPPTSPRLAVRTRSPFFERHLDLERSRNNTLASPRSPSLSPIWPDQHGMSRSNSHEGTTYPLIRRTPSEDERERLISTPSPIPPDLSPEEEMAIRAERKRWIEAQREAKKKGSAAVAATAIIAALKFDGIARTVAEGSGGGGSAPPVLNSKSIPRSSSPSPMQPRDHDDDRRRGGSGGGRDRSGLPLDKFPSNSSLASVQSSLLSSAAAADRRAYNQRDRAYSGSSAVLTPSTSYEFSHAGAGAATGSSPDLLSSSSAGAAAGRLRANSSASHKVGKGASGGAAAAEASDGRARMKSAGSVPTQLAHQQQTERAMLKVNTTSSPHLGANSKLSRARSPSDYGRSASVSAASASAMSSPIKATRSATLHPNSSMELLGGAEAAARNSRSRSNSLSPLSASARLRSGSMAERELDRERDRDAELSSVSSSSSRKTTGTPAKEVDLRGIEDLMRGLETDNVLESLKARRRERERSEGSVGAGSGGAATAAGMGPMLKARLAGSVARPPLPTIKTSDRSRS